ncbi:hypothetical protein UT300012_32370 [Paraclostridium bifermentans]
MRELNIVNEQVVLGKEFKVYGDFENPLFLAKSVADWIGHTDLSRMVGLVDEDEKLKRTIYVSGQNREMWFLTEDGLYEVLMQSRKPIAKQFKKEVKKILKDLRMGKTQIIGNDINSMINAMMPTLIQNTIQSTMMAMGTVLEQNNKAIMGEIESVKELHMESKDIINENEIRHKKELDETKELIGLRAKNTMSLTKLLKSRISQIKGEDIKAKDYHYILAKEKIFRAMQVWTWEEIPVNRFNDVHALIDSIETLEDIFDI